MGEALPLGHRQKEKHSYQQVLHIERNIGSDNISRYDLQRGHALPTELLVKRGIRYTLDAFIGQTSENQR